MSYVSPILMLVEGVSNFTRVGSPLAANSIGQPWITASSYFIVNYSEKVRDE